MVKYRWYKFFLAAVREVDYTEFRHKTAFAEGILRKRNGELTEAHDQEEINGIQECLGRLGMIKSDRFPYLDR